jgi:hypothetical protein
MGIAWMIQSRPSSISIPTTSIGCPALSSPRNSSASSGRVGCVGRPDEDHPAGLDHVPDLGPADAVLAGTGLHE